MQPETVRSLLPVMLAVPLAAGIVAALLGLRHLGRPRAALRGPEVLRLLAGGEPAHPARRARDRPRLLHRRARPPADLLDPGPGVARQRATGVPAAEPDGLRGGAGVL